MPFLHVRIPMSAYASSSVEPSVVGDVHAYAASNHGCVESFDWTREYVYFVLANVDKDAFVGKYPGCDAAYIRPTW